MSQFSKTKIEELALLMREGERDLMSSRRLLFSFAAIVPIAVTSLGSAAQITTLTFQPGTLPNGGKVETVWHESGFTLDGNPSFASISHGLVQREETSPSNGTDYLKFAFDTKGSVLTMDTGDPFSLLSIDLAEYSTVTVEGEYQTEFIQFQGLNTNGEYVYNEFQLDLFLDGVGGLDDFQTFYFDSKFENVIEVTLVDELFSLDNLVVYIPTSGTMIPVAIAGFISMQRKRYL